MKLLSIVALALSACSAVSPVDAPDVTATPELDAAAIALLSAPPAWSRDDEAGIVLECNGSHGEWIHGQPTRVSFVVVHGRDCAVAHTHPGLRNASMEAHWSNLNNRRPSAEDAIAVLRGWPNYCRGTDGSIHVVERIAGVYRIREVKGLPVR